MDLSDLIQKHARELAETARDAAQERRTEADLDRPAELYRARIERVDARLRLLEHQRAETDKRLADAIEAQKRLREELEKEAKAWQERAPGRTDPGPGSPRPTATPAKARRAAATGASDRAKAADPKAPRSGKRK